MRCLLSLGYTAVFALAFAGTTISQTCAGSGGCMDPTFGGGSLVRVPNAGSSGARSLLRQADGRLLAVANGGSNISAGQRITRLDPDGSVDTSFGAGGTVSILWSLVKGQDTFYGWAAAIGIQNVGGIERILVAGDAPMLSGKKVLTKRLRIDRLMPDGSLDTSWGTNGTLQFNLNGAIDMVVQPADQKIVIGTGSTNQLIRLSAYGQLDPLFGSGGIASVPMTQTNELHLDAWGRLLAAGLLQTSHRGVIILTPAIARYSINGTPDTSFGTNGRVLAGFNVSFAYLSVMTDAFAHVILGASTGPTSSTSDFTVARFTDSGAPDATFSGDGIAMIDFHGQRDLLMAAAVQSDGSIVLAGNTALEGSGNGSDIAMARVDYSGNVDPTFGNGGRIIFPHTAGGEAFGALLMVTDPVWAGERFYAVGVNNGANELLVARFMEY